MLKNCQNGSSMVEMIGVLGIISMIAVGLFATVSKIYDRYHQTAIVRQIRDLQKNIQTRYAAVADYSALNQAGAVQTLIAERVIPYDMVSDGRIYNAYGGQVSLSGSKNDYKITFADVKKGGCVDLLIMNWSVNNTSDLAKLKIGGKTFTWSGQNSASSLPISTARASSLCEDEQNRNEIEWTFQ